MPRMSDLNGFRDYNIDDGAEYCFADLNPPYSTIVADPPWEYEDRLSVWDNNGRRGQSMPYSTMSVEEIATLPVFDLVDSSTSAHLYLWTTNRFLWEARDVALGWGFTPSQVLVWCKPPRGLAPGGLYANATEFVVFARRSPRTEKRDVERAGRFIREAREAAGMGRAELHRLVRGGNPTGIVYRWEDDDSLPNETDWNRLCEVLPALTTHRPEVPPPPKRERRQVERVDRNWWEWPRGAHSVKPAGFLDIVEQVSPGPYVELFARQPRLGWDSWGYGYEKAAVVG